jgi:hypothetical protein
MALSDLIHLDDLLQDWRRLLSQWARTGELTLAAQEALQLDRVPERLQRLVSEWSEGDFSQLPPVVVLSGSVMPGAAGAYAISSGTIYLNAEWLQSAGQSRVLEVLTEELGHHMDGLLNTSDTPGDEGDVFSSILNTASFLNEVSGVEEGIVLVDDQHIGVEFSYESISGTQSILIENPFGIAEATFDIAAISRPGISDFIPYAVLSQAVKVASKSWEFTELITGLYADYGGGFDLENNYYAASDSYINLIKNIFEFALKDGILLSLKLTLPVPGRDAIVFAVETILDLTTGVILSSVNQTFESINSYLSRRLVNDAWHSNAFSSDTSFEAGEFMRGAISKAELGRRLNEKNIYQKFEMELSAFQQGKPPPFNDGVSEILIDQQNRIQFRKGLQRLFEEVQNPSDIVFLLNGATVNGVLASYLSWESGQVKDLEVRANGVLSLKEPLRRDISQGYFRNSGTVDVAEGSLHFSSSQTHTGVYIARTGELRFSGGVHTFTNDLDLQGDQFYFDGGEFTGLIHDQLNWIGGTAVDLTIAAGSRLVLTDSSPNFRTWSGEIVNHSQIEYKNEEINGYYPGPVVFGTRDKAAKFINENAFSLIGKYASLTSNYGSDNSWERRGQQQFINKGLFSRSGSGTSYIDIPFLNQGRLEVKEGDLSISGDVNIFTNEGLVDVQAGRLSITNTHSHTGNYIARTGEVRFSGGVHTFTNDLDLQGDQFYFDGGEFTGLIHDQLNWIGGTAVDLTIAAGSRLVLTDSSSSISNRAWSGEIVNRSRLEYKNEELTGFYPGYVVFGTSSKAARFINENEFSLIGKYASLTSSTGYNDGSSERRGQQQFINKGLFSRSGSGTSYIEIPFLNRGQVEVKEGELYIYGDANNFINQGLVDVQGGRLVIMGQVYSQHEGETLVRKSGNIVLDGNYGFELNGGILSGEGVVNGKVISTGQVKPGSGIGLLTFNGSYSQGNTGILDIDIGGTAAGSSDLLWVNGHASLKGSIRVNLASDFKPSAGDEFEILKYHSFDGSFEIQGGTLGDGLTYDLRYHPDRLVLSVVEAINSGVAAFAIAETPAVGNTLTASAMASDPDGIGLVGFSYQWQSSTDGTTWSPVGTNSASYLVASADQGKQLRLVVSYTDGQGFPETVTTTAGSVPLVNVGPAAFFITGTPAVGNSLTASATTADPDGNGTFSYAWQSSTDGSTWSPVGTNSSSYLVASADQGKQLRLVVSYTDGQGFPETITTTAGSVPLVNDGPASFAITGTPAVGNTLTASITTPDPDGNGFGAFSYSWQSSRDGQAWFTIGQQASLLITTALAGRQVRLRVAYRDGEGFEEAITQSVGLVPLPAGAPQQTVAITGLNDNLGVIQGLVTDGAISNDTTPTLSGTLSAALGSSETLRIYRNGALAGTASVSGMTWSYTHTTALSGNGTHTFTAAVVKSTGISGQLSDPRSMLLDFTAPTQTVTITDVSDDRNPVQGSVAPGGRTNDTSPMLSGSLSAALDEGETLKLYNGTIYLVDALVDPNTLTWTATPTLSSDGTYTIRARVQDAAGNQGPLSASRSLILDTVAPGQTVTISGISDNLGTIQGPVTDGGISNDTTPTLSGTLSSALAAAETLRIFNGSTVLGSATVNNTTGTWTYTPSTPLSVSGAYAFTAAVVDGAGNTGPRSAARSMLLDAPISTAQKDTLTGTSGPDIFFLPQLSWSLLGTPANPAYDTIIGFQPTDKLQLSGRLFNARLTSSAGVANSLAEADIANTLTPSWAANTARAFTTNGFSGMFVALNDSRAGFQPESDAILLLQGYAVSINNGISLV